MIEAGGCLVMALTLPGRPVGLIYADRQPSGRPLDADTFTSFMHFCQQANLGLAQVFRTGA